MRIISFAIWFVPPFSYGFVLTCRTAGIFSYAVPCVSFRLIRNTGTKSGRCPSGAAIYANVQNFLSRPMIGHTPRKLPALAAISRFIAFVNAPGCVALVARVLKYDKRKPLECQEVFFVFFRYLRKNFRFFHAFSVFSSYVTEQTAVRNRGSPSELLTITRNGRFRCISTFTCSSARAAVVFMLISV